MRRRRRATEMRKSDWVLVFVAMCVAFLVGYHVGWFLAAIGAWPWTPGPGLGDYVGPPAAMGVVGVSFLHPVAQDWRQGAASVARLLPFGDEHIVSWDAGGRTWGGGTFTPPTEQRFRVLVSTYAEPVMGKAGERESMGSRLRFVTGDFYMPASRTENQRCQRRAMVHLAREGNWVAEVDADEEWPGAAETVRALEACPGPDRWAAAAARYVHVYKTFADETALVLTAHGPLAVGDRNLCSGVKGATGKRLLVREAKVVNWWLADRGPDDMRTKLRSVSYMAGHANVDQVMRAWGECTPADAGKVPNVGGTLRGSALQSIKIQDLRAGKWEALTW